ncbi:MAG: ATP synthase F1 subunit gamma [Erysipelotrichaceae bacterium]
MANKAGFKNKIKSVESIHKITAAMKLMATAKLNKEKQSYQAGVEYALELNKMISKIIENLSDTNSPYLIKANTEKSLYIVYTSDLGMCGGYNINTIRLLQDKLTKDDTVVVFGNKGRNMMNNRGITYQDSYPGDDVEYSVFSTLANNIINAYLNKEYSRVTIICTKFVNTITFEPREVTLLPFVSEADKTKRTNSWEFEPDSQTILDQMMPMVLASLLYSYFLETKVSEQASRRLAMENATDNAQELIDKYKLQYNQARQTAITQEISEIVGGANAL